MRIHITGNAGSGKTSLAKELGEIPYKIHAMTPTTNNIPIPIFLIARILYNRDY